MSDGAPVERLARLGPPARTGREASRVPGGSSASAASVFAVAVDLVGRLSDGQLPVLSEAGELLAHSGCSGAPVEMALQAKSRGLPVVAITSLHGRAVTSRHPSGLRLFEMATLCIDTCAPYAGTAVRLPSQVGVCSVSSFAGVLIAQALTAEIVGRYIDAGVGPPLLVSRNLSGA